MGKVGLAISGSENWAMRTEMLTSAAEELAGGTPVEPAGLVESPLS